MKFIVDENLPWRVAAWLSERGHSAEHVSRIGLLGKPDHHIRAVAARDGACIVTRDADFIELSSGSAHVGVVRLVIGNCSTAVLLARLEALWPDVESALAAGERQIEVG